MFAPGNPTRYPMKQKNADLLLLLQAGLLGFAPLFAMVLLKTENYLLYMKLQDFLFISKISITDRYWVVALLISILAGAGIAVFYQSDKTKRGALLCLSSFAFLKSLLFMPVPVDALFVHPAVSSGQKKYMTILLVYNLLWFVVSLTTLIYFTRKEKKIMQTTVLPQEAPTGESLLEDINLEAETIQIASREKRFVNYLADSFLIVVMVSPVLSYFLGFGEGGIYADEDSRETLLQTLLGTVVYYILFEACFRSTPGKYLSGTRVIHRNGGPAGFLRVIGRTFCRLIPFDHFSFLGNRGWHDGISRTEIIEAPQIRT